MKILASSLREKKRYVSFQVIPEPGETFTYADLEAGVWNTFLDFFGEYGASKTSAWLLKDCWDEKKLTGIIRCNHKSVNLVIAGLGLIDRLGDNRVSFNILKVSGTIKKVKK